MLRDFKSRDFTAILRRPHSSYPKVVQGKCSLNNLHCNGAVCSNTPFSNTSALNSSLLFRATSTCKGSRTPCLFEHVWVPILGAFCSNKLWSASKTTAGTEPRNPETPKVHFKVRKMPFSTPRKKGPKSQLKCPKSPFLGN